MLQQTQQAAHVYAQAQQGQQIINGQIDTTIHVQNQTWRRDVPVSTPNQARIQTYKDARTQTQKPTQMFPAQTQRQHSPHMGMTAMQLDRRYVHHGIESSRISPDQLLQGKSSTDWGNKKIAELTRDVVSLGNEVLRLKLLADTLLSTINSK